MSVTVPAHERLCSSCGQQVEPDVYQAQAAEGFTDSAMCRSCLRGVRDNPQLEQLYEQIREALNDENGERWGGLSADDRFYFALHCINEGLAEGGSPGFHEHLRRYVCLLAAEDERET